MGIFDLFKKNKPVEQQVTNFFTFPRNDEGIQQVIDWVKQAQNMIIDLDENNHLIVKKTAEGSLFISAYTELGQRTPPYTEGEKFATVGFPELVQIFEENVEIDFLLLNPFSDSVQINRMAFTPKHVMKKDTQVQVGLPAEKPMGIINFLVAYGEKDSTVAAIYLGLMRYDSAFSYAVYIDSSEVEKIVPMIGPEISKICKEEHVPYPVDFIYTEFLKAEQYLIYKK